MNLDEAQRRKVAAWVAEGLRLSDIQNRLATELGISMTYMEVRFLVDDLKLTPKDVDRPKAESAALANVQPKPAEAAKPTARPRGQAGSKPATTESAAARVSVTVDQIARPGAVVSGKVTFTDGHNAEWYLDQSGRLGLVAQQAGYRPPPADLEQFQMALEGELSKLGF
jgi:hypothetical protein